MKDKLFHFLDKHSNLLWFLVIAPYIFFLASTATKTGSLIQAAAVAMMLCCYFLFIFWEIESTNRSGKKALQLLQDQRNSSSPEWDGYVRSSSDIEPRLQLLRNRIAQDQAEIDNIERVINL